MSRPELFPKTKPLDDPPDLRNTLRNGRRTPSYALAWAWPAQEYAKMIPRDFKGKLDTNIGLRWSTKYNFSPTQRPMAFPGADGNYYMIAMFNNREYPNFAERARDPDDPLLAAARDVLYIRPELEPTLMWYRFPMRWPLYVYDASTETEQS